MCEFCSGNRVGGSWFKVNHGVALCKRKCNDTKHLRRRQAKRGWVPREHGKNQQTSLAANNWGGSSLHLLKYNRDVGKGPNTRSSRNLNLGHAGTRTQANIRETGRTISRAAWIGILISCLVLVTDLPVLCQNAGDEGFTSSAKQNGTLEKVLRAFLPLDFDDKSILRSIWIIISLLLAFYTALRLWFDRVKPCAESLSAMLEVLTNHSQRERPLNFEELNDALLRSPRYGGVWAKFSEHLIREPTDDGIQIYSSVPPHAYINDENIIETYINTRLYRSLPALFTSFGILGTFVGITFGLSASGLGNLTEMTHAELKESMGELLQGASFAFSTSVWGILLSILFSIYEKRLFNGLSRQISQIHIRIDSLFPRKSPEAWLVEVAGQNRQQTAELKSFNTDLALSIADALDEKLAERLTPAIGELLSAVEELSKFKQESTLEAIRELVDEFKTAMTAGASQQIEDLRETLEDASQTMRESSKVAEKNRQESEAAHDRMVQASNEQIERMVSAVGDSQIKMNEDLSKLFSDMLGSTEEAVRQLQDGLKDSLSSHTAELTALLDSSKDTFERLDQSLRSLEEFLEVRFKDLAARYDEERSAIGELLQVFRENVDGARAIVQETRSAFQDVAAVSNSWGEITETLNATAIRLGDAQSQFSETLEGFEALVREAMNSMAQSTGALQEATAGTERSWRAYEDRFGQLREDLEASFETLHTGFLDYQRALQAGVGEVVESLDKELAKATNALGGAVEGLREAIEDLDTGGTSRSTE